MSSHHLIVVVGGKMLHGAWAVFGPALSVENRDAFWPVWHEMLTKLESARLLTQDASDALSQNAAEATPLGVIYPVTMVTPLFEWKISPSEKNLTAFSIPNRLSNASCVTLDDGRSSTAVAF